MEGHKEHYLQGYQDAIDDALSLFKSYIEVSGGVEAYPAGLEYMVTCVVRNINNA